jgi:bifunctional pyridoxal-dependent enzyme with beta-cystathionase and maltose regulon repressor activities
MSLADEARAGQKKIGAKTCSIDQAIGQHPKLATEILDLIADHTITTASAARTFAKHGIALSRSTIERHRNRQCINCNEAGRKL